MTVTAQDLLADIKSYLDITWDDVETERKLEGIIQRGMAYITRLSGEKTLDFGSDQKARELLFNYCRYDRENALHEFQTNYLPEILSFQTEKEVARYVAKQGESNI